MSELSQNEKDELDRQMKSLELEIIDAKHKYEELVSQYQDLLERRYPEKREERIKETLFQAYKNSDKTLDQILAIIAGDDDEYW